MVGRLGAAAASNMSRPLATLETRRRIESVLDRVDAAVWLNVPAAEKGAAGNSRCGLRRRGIILGASG